MPTECILHIKYIQFLIQGNFDWSRSYNSRKRRNFWY